MRICRRRMVGRRSAGRWRWRLSERLGVSTHYIYLSTRKNSMKSFFFSRTGIGHGGKRTRKLLSNKAIIAITNERRLLASPPPLETVQILCFVRYRKPHLPFFFFIRRRMRRNVRGNREFSHPTHVFFFSSARCMGIPPFGRAQRLLIFTSWRWSCCGGCRFFQTYRSAARRV